MAKVEKFAYFNDGFVEENADVKIAVEKNWKDPLTYSWSKVNVFAKPEKGPFKGKHRLKTEKQLLFDVTGICRPGELVAIMGASGAGKTTLLNVLTSRAGDSLRIQGDLVINGERMSMSDLTSRSAYVQQEDLFIGTMTVREQLTFQATLRIDRDVPKEVRTRRVNRVVSEFGLTRCLDTLIGIPGRIKGISGGETKRLAFACEVLTDPSLMFCDEPTSGLDSFLAQTIVSAMKFLADRGKAIICTIHQPSSEVFAMFDRVLLLAEGRLAYLGLTSDALQFFNRLDRFCPSNFNPADFFISTLAIKPDFEEECHEFVNHVCASFSKSEEMKAIEAAVKENMGNVEPESSWGFFRISQRSKRSPYKTNWFVQSFALNKRAFLEMAREPMLLRVKVFQTIMIAILIDLIYVDTPNGSYDQASVQNVNGCLFLLVTNLTFQFGFGVVNTFCSQLPIFLREHFNGMYRTDVFYLSKNLAEFPGTVLMPLLFLIIIYFVVNLHRAVGTFFAMALTLILVANVALSFGYFISTIAKDLKVAMAISAPMLIPFMLFGGFFLNSDTVPVYFIWLEYISWFNYANEALMISQWKNVETIDCPDQSLYCYHNGTEVISSLGYREDHFWFDIYLLVALIVFFRTLAFLSLLRRTY